MYRVTKIVTNDGKMFNNERDAKRHIENQYNGIISELALLIRGNDNVTKLKLIIDENIDMIEELIALKNEMNGCVEE